MLLPLLVELFDAPTDDDEEDEFLALLVLTGGGSVDESLPPLYGTAFEAIDVVGTVVDLLMIDV